MRSWYSDTNTKCPPNIRPPNIRPPQYKPPEYKPPKKCLRTSIILGLILGILRYVHFLFINIKVSNIILKFMKSLQFARVDTSSIVLQIYYQNLFNGFLLNNCFENLYVEMQVFNCGDSISHWFVCMVLCELCEHEKSWFTLCQKQYPEKNI